MSDLYDIYYAGKIVDGHDEAAVRENVARLFNANPATVEKLFSGKPQLIKRGVEKQAAIKYKAAMQKAGAVPLIRAHAAEKPAATSTASAATPPAAPEQPAPQKQSMAERLAALTGEPAPEADAPDASASTAAAAGTAATDAAPVGTAADADDSFSLAPAGSDVLREDERAGFEELDIDTSAIHLAPEFSEAEVVEREAPPAPDTSHMSMGDVGEKIPTLEEAVVELDPDVSHLSMGEVGEDIPHLDDEREPVAVDTSAIDLAPEGSDMLEAAYRSKDEPEAPDTSHIKLASTFDTPG